MWPFFCWLLGFEHQIHFDLSVGSLDSGRVSGRRKRWSIRQLLRSSLRMWMCHSSSPEIYVTPAKFDQILLAAITWQMPKPNMCREIALHRLHKIPRNWWSVESPLVVTRELWWWIGEACGSRRIHTSRSFWEAMTTMCPGWKSRKNEVTWQDAYFSQTFRLKESSIEKIHDTLVSNWDSVKLVMFRICACEHPMSPCDSVHLFFYYIFEVNQWAIVGLVRFFVCFQVSVCFCVFPFWPSKRQGNKNTADIFCEFFFQLQGLGHGFVIEWQVAGQRAVGISDEICEGEQITKHIRKKHPKTGKSLLLSWSFWAFERVLRDGPRLGSPFRKGAVASGTQVYMQRRFVTMGFLRCSGSWFGTCARNFWMLCSFPTNTLAWLISRHSLEGGPASVGHNGLRSSFHVQQCNSKDFKRYWNCKCQLFSENSGHYGVENRFNGTENMNKTSDWSYLKLLFRGLWSFGTSTTEVDISTSTVTWLGDDLHYAPQHLFKMAILFVQTKISEVGAENSIK